MFGRDGILTALSVLWADPVAGARRAAGAGGHAGHHSWIPPRDAQPGKILHEAREGEMAALGEIPFGALLRQRRCHAAVRAAGGPVLDRTGDLATIERLWPHLTRR